MGKMKKAVLKSQNFGKSSLAAMNKAAFKAGYWNESIDDIDYPLMASHRKWLTKEGKIIKYSKIQTDHLINILDIFNDGRFVQRIVQERGLREELLSRMSDAGQVLFGSK